MPGIASSPRPASRPAVAPAVAVNVTAAQVHNDAAIEAAFAQLAREQRSGLIVMTDAFNTSHRQRIIEVTQAVTISGARFDFASDFHGLEMLPEKGALIGHDDGREVRTPYDNCVLIMPSRRLVKGQTAVRLGRYID